MSAPDTAPPASAPIDARIAEPGAWRRQDPGPDARPDPRGGEEWQWRGVPVRSRHGIIRHRHEVKLTLAKGAALEDPAGLFNAGLTGNARRAIALHANARFDAGGVEGAGPCRRGAERRQEKGAAEVTAR